MSENKEKKKGFWGTLFSSKPSCGCSCGSSLIEEVPEDEKQSAPKQPDTDKESCCGKK